MSCKRCDDGGWVCENHPRLPWDGTSSRDDACHCGGAGAQCPNCYGSGNARGVYGEWCRDPNLCAGKGYCPRDPNCAD